MVATPQFIEAGKKFRKPFNERTKGELTLISKKGGESKSINKSEGAILRHIKERIRNGTMTEKDKAILLDRIENRASYGIDIMLYLDELKKATQNSRDGIQLAKTYVDTGKFIHGDKISVENKNLNLNATYVLNEEDKNQLLKFLKQNDIL